MNPFAFGAQFLINAATVRLDNLMTRGQLFSEPEPPGEPAIPSRLYYIKRRLRARPQPDRCCAARQIDEQERSITPRLHQILYVVRRPSRVSRAARRRDDNIDMRISKRQ